MQMTATQKVALQVDARTANDKPAKLDGAVQWQSSNPAVVEVVTDPDDSRKCVAFARGIGNAQVSAKADADLDQDEVREVNAFLDVTVFEEEAAIFAIVAGTPEEQ